MAVVTRASAWGRLRAVFCSRAIADARGGPTVALGEYRANSPCLALRWAHDRAGYLADQLDAPYARPVRAWLRDTEELEWALAFVAAGEPYVFRAVDDQGTRYVFTTEPVGGSPETLRSPAAGVSWGAA